jgi:putative hydrolase
MKIVIDPHTHTIASTHAYSTVIENAKVAAKRGIKLLGITDHAPALEDAPHVLHFKNLHVLDRELFGVKMLYGAELNICDYKGRVDLEETVLEKLDYCIASFHTLLLKPGSKKENTRSILGAMDNPYIKIIGHPDDGAIPVDYSELVMHAKNTKTMLEVNNSSLKTAFYRLNVRENLLEMLQLCEKHSVVISLGSDAHFANAVGNFDCAALLLKEIRFPEELVANTSVEKFLKLIGQEVGI